MVKWIGAFLVLIACGGFGYSLAAAHRREETALRQMIAALEYMQCELEYRMTPLADLCRETGQWNRNAVGHILLMLARELDCRISPDAECCMMAALESDASIPAKTKRAFEILGTSLGHFDVEGQLKGLESVRAFCAHELDALRANRDTRLRSYQTLGLCAGAALVILFI